MPRRKHLNSHYGCDTCKRRKVKCDETYPLCLRCVRYKQECPFVKLTAAQIEERKQDQVENLIKREKRKNRGIRSRSHTDSSLRPPLALSALVSECDLVSRSSSLSLKYSPHFHALSPPNPMFENPLLYAGCGEPLPAPALLHLGPFDFLSLPVATPGVPWDDLDEFFREDWKRPRLTVATAFEIDELLAPYLKLAQERPLGV